MNSPNVGAHRTLRLGASVLVSIRFVYRLVQLLGLQMGERSSSMDRGGDIVVEVAFVGD